MTTIDMERAIWVCFHGKQVATRISDGILYMRVNIKPSEPYVRFTRATKDKEITYHIGSVFDHSSGVGNTQSLL